MKKKIFFSYAWRDENINESFLVALRQWITNQGYDCYIDILDNNYDETAFQKQLMSVLKTCDIFFRIDSKEYLNSKWTQKEFEEAEANKIQIVIMSSEKLRKVIENNDSVAKYL
jgi:hypothetical protein